MIPIIDTTESHSIRCSAKVAHRSVEQGRIACLLLDSITADSEHREKSDETAQLIGLIQSRFDRIAESLSNILHASRVKPHVEGGDQ